MLYANILIGILAYKLYSLMDYMNEKSYVLVRIYSSNLGSDMTIIYVFLLNILYYRL